MFVDTDNTGLSGYQLTLLRTVVLVLLAEASYQLVERTFRTGKLFQRFGTRSTVVYAGLLSAAVILVAMFVITAPLPPTTLADAVRSSGRPAAANAMRVDVFGDSTAIARSSTARATARSFATCRSAGTPDSGARSSTAITSAMAAP